MSKRTYRLIIIQTIFFLFIIYSVKAQTTTLELKTDKVAREAIII